MAGSRITQADNLTTQQGTGAVATRRGLKSTRNQSRSALRSITNNVQPSGSTANKPQRVTTRSSAKAGSNASAQINDSALTSLTVRNAPTNVHADVPLKNTYDESDDLEAMMVSPSKSPSITSNFVKMGMQQSPQQLDPLDAADKSEPQMVSEYASDIINVWKFKEVKYIAPETFMEHQTEITPKMRGILLDWLVEVHLKFKLVPETLYLATNYIDRFLAEKHVTRTKLQLVGITAMLISCKYEEIYPPELNDFIFISDHAYNKEQILRMEELILNTLKFKVTAPSALSFSHRWIRAVDEHKNQEFNHAVQYFLELGIVSYDIQSFRPSLIAAASTSLALDVVGPLALSRREADNNLEQYSGYSKDDMTACINELKKLALKADSGRLTAVHRKYASSSFHRVAKKSDELFGVTQD